MLSLTMVADTVGHLLLLNCYHTRSSAMKQVPCSRMWQLLTLGLLAFIMYVVFLLVGSILASLHVGYAALRSHAFILLVDAVPWHLGHRAPD
jgi:hypothetical protein